MKKFIVVSMIFLILTGCTYNPFIKNNHTTGSAVGAIGGAAIGATAGTLLGGTRHLSLVMAGGIAGGALGYYLTTLRHKAAEIIFAEGEVYQLGDFIGIYLYADKLFEPNTADLLPETEAILDSVIVILSRLPCNHIYISGNTPGFSRAKWEKRLSLDRARKIAGYLWKSGVGICGDNLRSHRISYVGQGDHFPIAHYFSNDSIRLNNRIQITSFPTRLVHRYKVRREIIARGH